MEIKGVFQVQKIWYGKRGDLTRSMYIQILKEINREKKDLGLQVISPPPQVDNEKCTT